MNKRNSNGERDTIDFDFNRRGSDKPNPFNMGRGIERKFSDFSDCDSSRNSFRKYSDNRNGNFISKDNFSKVSNNFRHSFNSTTYSSGNSTNFETNSNYFSGGVSNLKLDPASPQIDSKPCVKINYSNYQNTFFFPKNSKISSPGVPRLNKISSLNSLNDLKNILEVEKGDKEFTSESDDEEINLKSCKDFINIENEDYSPSILKSRVEAEYSTPNEKINLNNFQISAFNTTISSSTNSNSNRNTYNSNSIKNFSENNYQSSSSQNLGGLCLNSSRSNPNLDLNFYNNNNNNNNGNNLGNNFHSNSPFTGPMININSMNCYQNTNLNGNFYPTPPMQVYNRSNTLNNSQTNLNYFSYNPNINNNYNSANTNSTCSSNKEDISNVNNRQYFRKNSTQSLEGHGLGGDLNNNNINNINMCNNIPTHRNSFPKISFSSSNNLNTFNSTNSTYNKFNLNTPLNNCSNNLVPNENTEVLTLKINSEDGEKILNIHRYDDLQSSVNKFIEQNKLNNNLMKPILIKINEALGNIYKVYNSTLEKNDEELINSLNILWMGKKENNTNTNELLTPPCEEKKERKIDNDHDNSLCMDITSISNISINEDDLYDDEYASNNFFKLNKSF